MSQRKERNFRSIEQRVTNLEENAASFEAVLNRISSNATYAERAEHNKTKKRARKAEHDAKMWKHSAIFTMVLLSLVCVFCILNRGTGYTFYIEQEPTTPCVISTPTVEPIMVTQSGEEPVYYDVPMSHDLQDDVRTACEESGIDMALALAVIQKETGFTNVMGDNGDSYGYMQIQPKWNAERMERLGVTDLLDPISNFRVGCDLLAELTDKYPLENALASYSSGKTTVNQYALDVMANYENIKGLVI